ncbi:hypothetical protein GC163_23970 [bacterium]|nr:hypothetical protein [bacterium]
MSSFHSQCQRFQTISLSMLAVGLVLPIALGLALPSVSVSPVVWNVLQIGGLIGGVTFGLLKKLSASKPATTEAAPAA